LLLIALPLVALLIGRGLSGPISITGRAILIARLITSARSHAQRSRRSLIDFTCDLNALLTLVSHDRLSSLGAEDAVDFNLESSFLQNKLNPPDLVARCGDASRSIVLTAI